MKAIPSFTNCAIASVRSSNLDMMCLLFGRFLRLASITLVWEQRNGAHNFSQFRRSLSDRIFRLTVQREQSRVFCRPYGFARIQRNLLSSGPAGVVFLRRLEPPLRFRKRG